MNFIILVERQGVCGSERQKCVMAEIVLLGVLNLYVPMKIRVRLSVLIIPSLRARNQSLLQSRSFQIL
jgi:hypothetical protein